ncbi:MAG TPA: cytochrome c oxidase assembly protein [Allosphingosinicella sp.]|jgi:cytochrome c oxidase assembly protein subunit 11
MTALAQRNGRTAALAALLVVAMIGLAFASVPLYRLFCQVTGFGGTPLRVSSYSGSAQPAGKIIRVRFDANTNSALPWAFEPESHVERVAVGAREMAFYTARNLGDKPVTGTATFNVTPSQAGQYFTKIQCFCFTEQTLKPGEEVRMPVVYFVDPKILEDADASRIDEITLSYTFYPVDSDGKRS